MSNLVAIAYDDLGTAQQVVSNLGRAQTAHEIELDDLVIVERRGDGKVKLTWDPPVYDGGSPITGYTATATPGGATCTATVTSCTIGGLTNGTTYSVTVRATNAIGSSPESGPWTATPRSVPTPPRNVTASGAATLSPPLVESRDPS